MSHRTIHFLCLSLAIARPGLAQIVTDDHALDSLQPAQPAASVPAPRKPGTHRKPAGKTPAKPAKPAVKQALAVPPMPAGPPANPVILPPPPVTKLHLPPPPPPVPVKPDAVGTAAAIPNGQRITFGPGTADLNPATLAVLRGIAANAIAGPGTIVSITAYAPGTRDDPSTPRRIALDRALAARAVLISAGMVSENIRAVAKGDAVIGDGPADRVDVTSTGPR